MVEPAYLGSTVGMRRWDGRQSFIEFHSWNFLRKGTSISSVFHLHVRVLQQRYINGFSRKTAGTVLWSWRQDGNEEKRENPEFQGISVTHLLRKRNSVAASHWRHGKPNSWKPKHFVITEAPCMVKPPRLLSEVGMRFKFSNSNTHEALLQNLEVDCSDVGPEMDSEKEKKNPCFHGNPFEPLLRKHKSVAA